MKTMGPLGLSAFVLLSAACSNTVEGLKKDADENKVQEKTEKAAQVVATAVQDAGREIKATTMALDIKTTLMADKAVDASHLHVDADDEAKTVTLTGSVPTAVQRDAAGAVARAKSGDYRVRNLLTIAKP